MWLFFNLSFVGATFRVSAFPDLATLVRIEWDLNETSLFFYAYAFFACIRSEVVSVWLHLSAAAYVLRRKLITSTGIIVEDVTSGCHRHPFCLAQGEQVVMVWQRDHQLQPVAYLTSMTPRCKR